MVLAVRLGLSTRGVHTGAQSVHNAFGGVTKRDNSTGRMGDTLISMDPEAIKVLQPLAPKINDLSLVHIGKGSQNVEDSIALGFGTPDAGVKVRHVTNGTHGFAQVLSQSIDSSDLDKRESYSLTQRVAGLKFSYSKRCSDNDYYVKISIALGVSIIAVAGKEYLAVFVWDSVRSDTVGTTSFDVVQRHCCYSN